MQIRVAEAKRGKTLNVTEAVTIGKIGFTVLLIGCQSGTSVLIPLCSNAKPNQM